MTTAPQRPAARILITGAGGFIGNRLWRVLTRRYPEMVCRGMLHTGSAVRSGRMFSDAVFADLLDPPSLTRACEGVDAIIHCAGSPPPVGDETDPAAIRARMEVLHHGTHNLLEAAGRAGVRRFVHLSSVRAAGHPGNAVADETWGAPPETVFGQAKRRAEQAVLEAGQAYGMATVNLRLAPVYGHGCRGEIGWLIEAIRAGWMPPLPQTSGRHNLIHVADVLDAAITVLHAPRAAGQTYIVAHPTAFSGAQLHDAVRTVMGLSPRRWRVSERWLRLAGRWGDRVQRRLHLPTPLTTDIVSQLLDSECYAPTRIRAELGWQARVNLEAGLRDCIRTAPTARPITTPTQA